MRRREILGLLGCTVMAVSSAARAQQGARIRRLGLLQSLPADDTEAIARLAALRLGLQQSGWRDGDNLLIEYRSGAAGDPDQIRRHIAELVAFAPDVIVAHGSPIMRQLRREIRNVPIVFVSVSDPVTHGFVASLARPGGNATGFVTSELSFSAKWLELLKEIAPTITRAAIIRDPDQVTTAGRVAAIQTAAASLRVELSPIDIRDTSVMERAVAAFASQPGGGIIVPAGILAQIHRKIIVAAAARQSIACRLSLPLLCS